MRFPKIPLSETARSYLVTGLDASMSGSVAPNALADQPPPALPELETEPWIAVVGPDVHPFFLDARTTLAKSLDARFSTVAVLVAWRRPPDCENLRDDIITSFLCSSDLFRQLAGLHPGSSTERLCFFLLSAILDGEITVDRLVVKQLPIHRRDHSALDPEPERIIMAHRGLARHLHVALRSIQSSASPNPAVSVGLDGGAVSKYRVLARNHPKTEFLRFSPTPVGPYVIRQELIDRSTEPILFFQDSDDFATWDRFACLREELRNSSSDLVGCHELRVDQTSERVIAVRYPLDVNAALQIAPGHTLLHGTCSIRRSAFLKAGGLSTDKLFSADTQFLLRAHFTLRIRNIDEFLYVRRLHKRSLTLHPSTGEMELRESLHRPWKDDFRKVESGELTLENSSLRAMRRAEPFEVSRL